ncbi:MAG TPA: NnrU family protein [Methylococcus sp.]|nr:NnrU family protein [Methylococcus sp.]
MIQLLFAASFFVGLHFVVAGTQLRTLCIGKIGERNYRIVFSALSLLGLFWLIQAYRNADPLEIWGTPAWSRPLAALLMLPAFLLVVLGITTPHPIAVSGEKRPQRDDLARGVLRITRHPLPWGAAIWALAHLLANGDAASLVLFGSLLLLVLGSMRSIDAKRRKTYGEHWERFAAVTSVLPFGAIRGGRNRLVWHEFKVWQLGLAVVAYVLMFFLHPWLFSASPL